MFTKKTKPMAKHTETIPDMGINRIVEGTLIEGEIRCESNIRIDGSFVGNLTTKGRLVIGPAGRIEGTVNCQNAEIEGLVKGKLFVQQMLSLKGTAKVEGDIFTDSPITNKEMPFCATPRWRLKWQLRFFWECGWG